MPKKILMNSGGPDVSTQLAAQFASVDPSIYAGLRQYWNSFSDPYAAWTNQPFIDLIGTRLKAGASPYATQYDPMAEPKGGTPLPYGGVNGNATPSDIYKWAFTGGGTDKAGQQIGYQYNPNAFNAANLNFSPLDVVRRQADLYRAIDPNFDPDKLETVDHPVFGKVVSVQNLPKLEQTSGEEFGEMLGAAALIAGGALGISGFAGLHGLPGIDSLLSGFTNFGGGGSGLFGGGSGGSAISGSALAEELAALGISGPDAAGLISALGGAGGSPINGTALAEEMANLGIGNGSTSGMLSSLGGGSSNPMQALQQALQGQVESGVLTPAQMQSALSSVSQTGSTGSSWLDSLLGNSSGGGLMGGGWGSILSGGLQAIGGLLSGNQAQDAAKSTADAYIQAAKIAADAAKFKPVGVTTRFGSSNFGYDANGNLTNAGYQLSPDIKAQQTSLMGASGDALQQYLGAQAATAPMGQTAQSLFGLGQGYLGTTPQEQAARYMSEQQALLAPTRERDFAALENRLANQGRLGLATGGTSTGLGAANPELESFYNAQRMQDLKLASEATQGGMDYARFGAGLVGTGGDMLRSMYGTQVAAYDPYRTAIGGASMLEGLGQNAMDLGINIGAKGTAANAQSGMLLSQGMTNAANAMQPSNSFSPWGNLLSGAGTMLQNYNQQQPQQQQQAGQFMYNPYTGQPVNWN